MYAHRRVHGLATDCQLDGCPAAFQINTGIEHSAHSVLLCAGQNLVPVPIENPEIQVAVRVGKQTRLLQTGNAQPVS